MFLKYLKIENNGHVIRNITFHKGINLIIDETKTEDKKESGNNVGKTTVLRLIDFCLGGEGKNIYQDTEFKNKTNTQIEKFLKDNNIIISLALTDNIDNFDSPEIVIRRNFLKYTDKIQEINGNSITNDKKFDNKLKELVFQTKVDKPTFRQIISKNIRDEKNRLINTVKVLHQSTKAEEYEALYLFWLGISIDTAEKKQKLLAQKTIETNLQKRLRRENNLSQINQSLEVVNTSIRDLEIKKDSFNINKNYDNDLNTLNQIKFTLNKYSTEVSRLELRKELINESKSALEKDTAQVDIKQLKAMYEQANSFIPNMQKSFEDTLTFHNQMINEKIKFITQELPELEQHLKNIKRHITELLIQEKSLSDKLIKSNAMKELQETVSELNKLYEIKGNLEEKKRLWEKSSENLQSIIKELNNINNGIVSNDELIKERISAFNKYFADISYRLYGERFVLSSDKNEKGYELNISSIGGNLGTGKKKGQIASFDFAYIQFADSLGIDCLHFILQDQIENVHDNQITNLLTEIVIKINCQYVLPVLKDKLPDDIDIKQYEILSLSQSNKLFKIE